MGSKPKTETAADYFMSRLSTIVDFQQHRHTEIETIWTNQKYM